MLICGFEEHSGDWGSTIFWCTPRLSKSRTHPCILMCSGTDLLQKKKKKKILCYHYWKQVILLQTFHKCIITTKTKGRGTHS